MKCQMKERKASTRFILLKHRVYMHTQAESAYNLGTVVISISFSGSTKKCVYFCLKKIHLHKKATYQ